MKRGRIVGVNKNGIPIEYDSQVHKYVEDMTLTQLISMIKQLQREYQDEYIFRFLYFRAKAYHNKYTSNSNLKECIKCFENELNFTGKKVENIEELVKIGPNAIDESKIVDQDANKGIQFPITESEILDIVDRQNKIFSAKNPGQVFHDPTIFGISLEKIIIVEYNITMPNQRNEIGRYFLKLDKVYYQQGNSKSKNMYKLRHDLVHFLQEKYGERYVEEYVFRRVLNKQMEYISTRNMEKVIRKLQKNLALVGLEAEYPEDLIITGPSMIKYSKFIKIEDNKSNNTNDEEEN